jgi:hypothetical protein
MMECAMPAMFDKFLCAHPKSGRIVNQLMVAIKWKKKKKKLTIVNTKNGGHVISQSAWYLIFNIPQFLMHNALDFVQILYFAGWVCIINEKNMFHSFFRLGNHMSTIFGVYYC